MADDIKILSAQDMIAKLWNMQEKQISVTLALDIIHQLHAENRERTQRMYCPDCEGRGYIWGKTMQAIDFCDCPRGHDLRFALPMFKDHPMMMYDHSKSHIEKSTISKTSSKEEGTKESPKARDNTRA